MPAGNYIHRPAPLRSGLERSILPVINFDLEWVH